MQRGREGGKREGGTYHCEVLDAFLFVAYDRELLEATLVPLQSLDPVLKGGLRGG